VGRWSRRLSGNTPGPGTERDPAGVRQDSPGRKPWGPWRARMSALTGRCRRLRPFQAGILGVHVARARALAFAARPFRVGAWEFLQVRRCVLFPRACALGCPARPFQGHLRSVSASHPGRPAKHPGRPAKHPGRPAKHPGRPAKHPINGTDPGWLLTAVPLRLIRVSQEPGRQCTPTVSRVGNSQRCARQANATPSRRVRSFLTEDSQIVWAREFAAE